jgi:hypothetical protein
MDFTEALLRTSTTLICIGIGLQIYSIIIILRLKKFKVKKADETRFSYNAHLLLTIPLIIQIITILIQNTYGISVTAIRIGIRTISVTYTTMTYVTDALFIVGAILSGIFLGYVFVGWIPKDGKNNRRKKKNT